MQNTESKALSTEIASLFDRIRKQATEYSAAMDDLRSIADQANHHIAEMKSELKNLRKKTDNSILKLEDTAQETLRTIDTKSSDIERVYQELHTIETTKQSLIDLSRTLKHQKDDLERSLHNFENRVKKATDDAFGVLENRLAFQIQQMKEELRQFDNKILAVHDQHRREKTLLQGDMDDFKSKITETRYIVDETTKIIQDMLEKAERNLDSKVVQVRAEVEKQIKSIQIEAPQNSDKAMDISALQRDINQIREKVRLADTKASAVMPIAVGSAIGAVILSAIISFLLR